MVDPLSTGALIGIGWAGKKILGPSLDEIGVSLKAYAGERIKKILKTAETIDTSGRQVEAVPTAFALRFFQSASLSEDDELMTNMWANLLVNAAIDFNSRKVLYLDILDKLSAEDAAVLNNLIEEGKKYGLRFYSRMAIDEVTFFATSTAKKILEAKGQKYFDQDSAEELNSQLWEHRFSWPIQILTSEIPFVPATTEGTLTATESVLGLANSTWRYDPLIRQRLMQEFDAVFDPASRMRVGGVMATDLGVEFVNNCRGIVN